MVIFTPEDEIMFRQRVNPSPNTSSEGDPDPGPESELVSKIRKWAKQENYPCRIHPQSPRLTRFIEPGDPDIILFLPDERVALFEAKVKGGRLSKAQKNRAITYSYLNHTIYKIISFKQFLKIVEEIKERKGE